MQAGSADWAVLEVPKEHRYTSVLSISLWGPGNQIQGPPTAIPLSEECQPNNKDL